MNRPEIVVKKMSVLSNDCLDTECLCYCQAHAHGYACAEMSMNYLHLLSFVDLSDQPIDALERDKCYILSQYG